MVIERAVSASGKKLNVAPIRKTNIISVSYTSSSPDKAAYVVRDLGERYLNAHLAAHSAPGSYKFFAEQAAKFRDQLKAVQNDIYQFHRKTQIFSMPQQSTAVIGHLEDTKAQIKDLDTQIRDEETRVAQNESELGSTSERLNTQIRNVSNQMAVQQLQTMLTDLQNRRIALGVKFKPTDRSISELDREIENTTQALARAQSSHLTESTSDINTVHQALTTDLLRTRIQLAGHRGIRALLAQNVGRYTARLDEMDEHAATLHELEQAERQTEENYALYARRLEEARMAESLDQQKFSNVIIIENPVASPIPTSPRLGLTLAIGFFIGLALSVVVAFLVESGGGSTATAGEQSDKPAFHAVRAYSVGTGD